jgi:hypothetical protein
MSELNTQRLVRDDVRKHVEALLRTLGIESKGVSA